MRPKTRTGLLFGVACAGLAFASASFADADDPPSRVARVAYAQGAVSFQPAGTEDWVVAPVNRPLTTGDTVWADQDARVEIELDQSVIRLSNSTELSFVNLGDEITQVQLTSGSLLLRIRRLDDNETYEVDTPNVAFSVLRPGLYRISVDAAGYTTAISVRSGQGEASGGGNAYSMYAADSDDFSGTDQLRAVARPPIDDGFDAWGAERDSRRERSQSASYVSADVIGYGDLDDHGSWRTTPEYGPVWYPSGVAVGWAPYQAGHWAYIAPWGYTWVDDQPWGFAPFHYGRWIWGGGAWGWVPTPPRPERGAYIRPVYAPALVAWVGAGATIAWFALGPREVYVPSYAVSPSYVRNVNVSNTRVNTTVINNVYNTTIVNNKSINVTYVNRSVPGAVTGTSMRAFSTAQPVASNRVRLDERVITEQTRNLAPAVVPTKQAVLGLGRNAPVKPPAAVQTRSMVVRVAPPRPPPLLDRRLEAIKNNGGKPLSVAQVRQIAPAATAPRSTAIRVAPPATPIRVAPPPSPQRSAPPGAAVRVAPPAAAVGVSTPAVPAPTPVQRPPEAPSQVMHAAPAAIHPNELPPTPRPASPSAAESVLEREHLQQQLQLRAQQEEVRARVQQQQEQQHQELARQQADEAKKQELERQHQEETQHLQKAHIEEQQQLEARQKEQKRAAVTKPTEPHKGP